MTDLEKVKLMKDCNWKPATQYWKEEYGKALAIIESLEARVAGLVAERDHAFDWAKTQHAAADEYAARVKAAESALATARDDALEAAAHTCDAAAQYRARQIETGPDGHQQCIRWTAGKLQAEILGNQIRAMKGGDA